MIDINLIRQDPKGVADRLARRGMEVDFTELLELDTKKRKLQAKADEMRAERNRVNKEIPSIKDPEQKNKMIAAMKALGEKLANIGVDKYEKKIFDIMAALPNLTLDDVQAGGKEQNRVVKTFGEKPKFNFTPKSHYELCVEGGLIDYERGAKISGAGTWLYTGLGARLEWALLNYFIDFHVKNGYTFILPPHLLNQESGYAAGQFPKFKDDVFLTGDKFLLPTSETAILNMYRDEIIDGKNLPLKLFAYSPCYRKEAGGYGASERGMIRGHQFNKVEMFIFCKAEDSAKYHTELISNAEKLVEGLGLHYQTVALAAGDVGAAMAKTHDIEIYIPSMKGYKEVSSASNACDYQARRAGIRTRVTKHVCGDDGCKMETANEFIHTLNASGLATSRVIPAIVEQFQKAAGTFEIPQILKKYMFQ